MYNTAAVLQAMKRNAAKLGGANEPAHTTRPQPQAIMNRTLPRAAAAAAAAGAEHLSVAVSSSLSNTQRRSASDGPRNSIVQN